MASPPYHSPFSNQPGSPRPANQVQANPIQVRRAQPEAAQASEPAAELVTQEEIPVPAEHAPPRRPVLLSAAGVPFESLTQPGTPFTEPVEYQAPYQPEAQSTPSVEASAIQIQGRRPRILTTMTGEAPQTPETLAEAEASSRQDPEIAQLDAGLTSVGDIPYYSLSQVLTNLATVEPSVLLELAPKEETADIPIPRKPSGPRYENEVRIGEGGTAVVYLAQDTRLRRRVALKRFKKISRSNHQSDYLNELESASRISHPYVVSTYDADIDEKSRYIVMEYIDGVDMETAIAKDTVGFDLNRFMNFALKSLEGLEATHTAGLLHLDLKPSNIMLNCRDGGRDVVKIVDFGRAQPSLDEDGVAPRGLGMNGSIFYSAPEQLLSEKLDPRTDLYSLGCIFYWVLAKTRPYDGPNAVSIMSAHLKHQVKDIRRIVPSLPEWLAELIMAMISQEKSDRPASAQIVMMLLGSEGNMDKVTQIHA